MNPDEKFLMVIELRDVVKQYNPKTVAIAIGRTEQTVRNFTEAKTGLPWPSTISELLSYVVEEPRTISPLLAQKLAAVRARIRTRSRTRVVPQKKHIRKSVTRATAEGR